MVKRNDPSGFTLAEMMVVLAILGFVCLLVPGLISLSVRFYQRYTTEVVLQQQARVVTDVIGKFLNDAKASSVTIDQLNSPQQPPYSRITFTTIQGTWVQFYQIGTRLFESTQLPGAASPSTVLLTSSAHSLQFEYPRSDNPIVVDIKITLQAGLGNSIQRLEFKMDQVHLMNT